MIDMADFDQIIEKLNRAIGPKRRDKYGPDPFSFRKENGNKRSY